MVWGGGRCGGDGIRGGFEERGTRTDGPRLVKVHQYENFMLPKMFFLIM